jgi:chorismate dehydratase|tara:strand:+ start:339 stop:998 length:660 start_codon:yes stop_codon:yes gene_type:complete
MQKVITKDNSITFHNEKYDETYHSISGALEEAFEKFARPCKLKDGMNVLDVCFGLGYNSLAAIYMANVSIVALENDSMILKQIRDIEIPIDYNINQDSIKNNNLKNNYNKIKIAAEKLSFNDDKVKIKIILGDARETIKDLDGKFDAVFLDPFSPKKCPELWTGEFFKDIRKLMKSNSVLATYSCASSVRKNLEKAGFVVKDGPSIGRKAPSTIAYCLK